jgi:hypothetical protein
VVVVQPHKKGVEIFAVVAGGEGPGNFGGLGEPEPRRFYVAKTGETVVEPSAYVGSATFPGINSRHVFQLD